MEEVRWYIKDWWMAIPTALEMAGTTLQLYHDSQTGTFASNYALFAQVAAVQTLFNMVWHVPAIVGVYDAHPGLQVFEAVHMVLGLAMAWQSRMYPRVEQDVAAEDGEEVE
jgi:hypothetical protein